MPYLSTNRATIYYETIGEVGPWIVLLNGYTRTSSDFRLIAKKLEASGMRIVLMDNRGSGQSTTETGFTMEDMADDLAAIVDHLGIASLHVLGISLGGVIAQCFTSRHPSLTAGLLLISTSHQKEDFAITRLWPEDLASAPKIVGPLVSEEFRQKNPLLFQALCKNMWQQGQREEFRRLADEQRQALHRYLAKRPSLAGVRCPTLIVHGEEDAIIPCQAAEDLQQAIPHARLKRLPGAGHLLLVERPTELLTCILDFVPRSQVS